MNLKNTFFSLILFAGVLNASPIQCGGIYYGNTAYDILNIKLIPKTKELCYSAFAVMHSVLT